MGSQTTYVIIAAAVCLIIFAIWVIAVLARINTMVSELEGKVGHCEWVATSAENDTIKMWTKVLENEQRINSHLREIHEVEDV